MARTVSNPEPTRVLPPDSKPPRNRRRWTKYLSFPNSPSFKSWFRNEWSDLLLLVIFLVLPVILYYAASPLGTKLFPYSFSRNSEILAPHLSYPKRKEYINTWVSTIISFGVPFLVIGIAGLVKFRSFWDANAAVHSPCYQLVSHSLHSLYLYQS